MKTKTVFYLRVQDAKNRRYWHDSQNYDTMDELFAACKEWLVEHRYTPVIFAQREVMTPE